MARLLWLAASLAWLLPGLVSAQAYDLLLRGGHVIDPKNGIDEVRDIAIQGNPIATNARLSL